MTDNNERVLGWDDTIENDSSFTVLPAGDYHFTVTGFERARYEPGPKGKLPPCNKAVLTIALSGDEGTCTVTHNLFLHSRCEGMLCEFFTAIGQRRHGEPLRMNWQTVPGSTGRCKVGVRKWTGRDGSERESNEILRFYEPAAKAAPQQSFTPGAF